MTPLATQHPKGKTMTDSQAPSAQAPDSQAPDAQATQCAWCDEPAKRSLVFGHKQEKVDLCADCCSSAYEKRGEKHPRVNQVKAEAERIAASKLLADLSRPRPGAEEVQRDFALPRSKAPTKVRLLAALMAQGRLISEAAELLDCSEEELSAISESPFFLVTLQAEKDALAAKAKRSFPSSSSNMKGAIEEEGSATLAKLVELRDSAESEKVQLGAASALLDRIAPKRTEEERTIRLALGADAVAAMRYGAAAAIAGTASLQGRFAGLEAPVKPKLPAIFSISDAIGAIEEEERPA